MQQLNIGLKGKYCIHKVMNAGTALEYRIPILEWFDNVITNDGLNWFCNDSNTTNFLYGHVGSGNTAPAVTDIGLVSSLVSEGVSLGAPTIAGNYGSPNYTKYIRWVHRYNAGVGTGNIAEIGIGKSTKTTPYLFSRALILDGMGTPTTITKLADEVLDTTYELQFQLPTTDFSGGFTLTGDKGNSYIYTGRSANISASPSLVGGGVYCLGAINPFTAYTGSIGAITTVPSGTNAQISATAGTYTSGTYVRNYSISAGIDYLNLSGGILSCTVGNSLGLFQFQFNTAIPKTSSDTLSLNFSIGLSRT